MIPSHDDQPLKRALLALDPIARERVIRNLPDKLAIDLAYDWKGFIAREKQLPPKSQWLIWLILAGRGFGKSRTGAEFIRDRVESGVARHIAFVGRAAADVRDIMVEGPAGILAVSPPNFRPRYEPSKRRLTWPNGATATCFTSEKPDQLRGPQHDTAWADEVCAWKYQEKTWSNLEFGLRLGNDPRCVVTTTPRPTKLLKAIIKDPSTAVTKGSTHENAANLAKVFLSKLIKKYEGTRLGRQELDAEILGDTPGALWKLTLLDANRVDEAPELKRIIVALDPATTSTTGKKKSESSDNTNDEPNEFGIIVAGLGYDDHAYILDDQSGIYTPAEWSKKAVELFDEYECDHVVAEANQGGEMITHAIHTVMIGNKKRDDVSVKLVHASRGKRTRAEPISSLDEQGRIHHVGCLTQLEDQMTTWDATSGAPSPDRMDARVWACHDLMIDFLDRGELSETPEVIDNNHWGNSGRGF